MFDWYHNYANLWEQYCFTFLAPGVHFMCSVVMLARIGLLNTGLLSGASFRGAEGVYGLPRICDFNFVF